MKKITGKVVSLVLALALVVSSFSANFAFASKRSVNGTVDLDGEDTLYLVNSDANIAATKDNMKVTDLKGIMKPVLDTKDHEDLDNDIKISAISHVSGDSLMKWDIHDDDDNDGNADLEIKKSGKDGTEVLSVLFEDTYTDDDDNDITVKARQELTVHVLQENSLIIGKAGKECEEPDAFAMNKGSKVGMQVYKATKASNVKNNAKAVYEPVNVTTLKEGIKAALTIKDSTEPAADVLTVTAKAAGSAGNKIKIAIAAATETLGEEDGNVKVTEPTEANDETTITVYATGSKITASAMATAINDDNDAKDLVEATVATGKEDTEISAAAAAGNLKDGADLTAYAYIELSSDENVHFDKASTDALDSVAGDNTFTIESGKRTKDATTGLYTDDGTDYQLRDDAKVGNITITAKEIKDGKASDDSDDEYKLKTKVEKKVDVETLCGTGTTYSVNKDGSKVYIEQDPISKNKDKFNVKDCELVFPIGTRTVTVKNGSLNKISGTVGTLTIEEDANVDVVDGVIGDVKVVDGKVGNISTDDGASHTVTIDGGRVGDVEADFVTVKGGTVGNVNTDLDKNRNNKVTIESDDDEDPITVGKITTKDANIFADESKVTIASIKSTENSTDGITLIGDDKLLVKTIDLDYYDVDLTFGDDDDEDEFIGTIAAPLNADNAKIKSEAEDTKVTMNGAVTAEEIYIDSDTAMNFDSKVTVDTIDGDGEMKINAGNLYVKEGASSVTLKLADTALAAGQTVFKCDKDAVDDDDFDCFGFTLEKVSGNDVDTFKIKSLAFAGPSINKTSSKIAKGYSETFTASAYPAGTALPEGTSIKWELDGGSTDVFKLTTEGNTAKVEVVSIDGNFASENVTTLKAILCDKDGDEMDDYDAAECEITAIAVPEAVSDTTSNFALAQGSSYQFKITSATQPNFAVGTAGVFSSALVAKNGNDYFYKITAIGKPGQEAGIYLNGETLLVASVKAPAFKCDTTMKTTVKGSYTVKVTADKAPSFAVGTAGVFKAEFVSNKGNDYFYKITSTGKKGAEAGIYVNGVKAFVAVVG